MTATPTTVSVIVACRNETRHIEQFIDSVLGQQVDGADWEIVLADGMSDDGTRERLTRYTDDQPRLRVIDNPGKIVSTGLNAAIREARGEIIARMDVHTEYAPDYISQCVRLLNDTKADCVGGPWVSVGQGYFGRAISAAFHSPFAVGGGRAHDPEYEGPIDTVYLGCWRREVLRSVGLFDPTLVRNQDDELNLRIVRSGGTVWQSPKIVSRYSCRATLRGLFRQYLQYGFWKVAVIAKHRIPASVRHLAPGAFVGANLVLLLTCLASALTPGDELSEMLLAVQIAIAGTYALTCSAAACLTAARYDWRLLPALPLVFATYHISYGLGFLAGLVCRPLGRRSSPRTWGWFTALSR
jgi:glycosyltransferase involved in cell wall biosynthesis